jgi:hypothetical protein
MSNQGSFNSEFLSTLVRHHLSQKTVNPRIFNSEFLSALARHHLSCSFTVINNIVFSSNTHKSCVSLFFISWLECRADNFIFLISWLDYFFNHIKDAYH